MSAAVTVLSNRTTLPASIFSRRALAIKERLIASHVSARMALIVLCSTDFFGAQDAMPEVCLRHLLDTARAI